MDIKLLPAIYNSLKFDYWGSQGFLLSDVDYTGKNFVFKKTNKKYKYSICLSNDKIPKPWKACYKKYSLIIIYKEIF